MENREAAALIARGDDRVRPLTFDCCYLLAFFVGSNILIILSLSETTL